VAAVEAQAAWVALSREAAGDRWKDPADDEGHRCELVFPNTLGGPLREAHVNEAWHELLRSIGLEGEGLRPVRMHDLRHSKGTVMSDEGEDLVVIQRTLGHAKSSITADLYVGKVPKALRSAADRWDALLDAGAVEAPEAAGEAVS